MKRLDADVIFGKSLQALKSIFLSYSCANAEEAERLDVAFSPAGVNLKRDIREIAYKDSIKTYMQTIAEADYALLLISDAFLRSPNCMYEVLQVFRESDRFYTLKSGSGPEDSEHYDWLVYAARWKIRL